MYLAAVVSVNDGVAKLAMCHSVIGGALWRMTKIINWYAKLGPMLSFYVSSFIQGTPWKLDKKSRPESCSTPFMRPCVYSTPFWGQPSFPFPSPLASSPSLHLSSLGTTPVSNNKFKICATILAISAERAWQNKRGNIIKARKTGIDITQQSFGLVRSDVNITVIVIKVRSLKTCNIGNRICRIITNRSEKLFIHSTSCYTLMLWLR